MRAYIATLCMMVKGVGSVLAKRSGTRKSVGYLSRPGGGRAVHVMVSESDLDHLTFRLERKIEHDDYKDGALIPIAVEEVKQRGGKRILMFKLSHESARGLRSALEGALKDIEERRSERAFMHRTFGAVALMMEHSKLVANSRY